MKLSIYPTRRIKHKSAKGFALIATMILMILLAAVAVVLMAIAANQNRISMSSTLIAAARQQALVGLDAAIAELQAEMGPDQRVSASSGVMADAEESEPEAAHILGVWNSWDGPIYGSSKEGHADSISETYDKGRTSMFRRWLISTRGDGIARQAESYQDLSSRRQGQRICLIGEGTLGTSVSKANYVYADLVSMPSTGKNTAEMAWWVGGENQKANAAVENPEESDDTIEILHRTWNTPAPVFSTIEALQFVPNDMTESTSKLLSINSLPLVTRGSQDAGASYFFDVTTRSQSLPINVRTGGFKQDLCLLLDRDSMKDTDFARRSSQDCPIVEFGDDLDSGTSANRPIGSWQTLHAFYNTWPNGTADDNDNFTARLIGSVDDAYTRMSGSGYKEDDNSYLDLNSPDEDDSSKYDTKSLLDEGYSEAGYARTPIVLAFLNNLSLCANAAGVTSASSASGTSHVPEAVYVLKLSPATTVLWWNPYNVPMKIRGQQLSAHTMPYMMANIQTRSVGYMDDYVAPQLGSGVLKNDNNGNYYYGREGLNWTYNTGTTTGRYSGDSGSGGLGYDTGTYFIKEENSDTDDIEFEPGEILFFSPCESILQSYTALPSEYNALAVGFNPNKVNNLGGWLHWTSDVSSIADESNLTTLTNMQNREFVFRCRFPVSEPLDCDNVTHSNGASLYYLTGSGSETTGGYGNWIHDGYYEDEFEVFSIRTHFTTDPSVSSPSSSMSSSGVLRNGKSPYLLQTAWYSEEEVNDDDTDAWICDSTYWEDLDQLTDENTPYFFASFGIVTKSANSNLFPSFVAGDFRTKIWQHSNPALGGDVLIMPDDSERAYHPYHVTSIPIDVGMSSSPMDNIGDNGTFGITSDGEQVSFISAFELPVHPPFSLAAFSGMKLLPGWYDSGASDEGMAREVALRCQRGVPTVGIGNSFADPTISANSVYEQHDSDIESYPNSTKGGTDANNKGIFTDYYDHGFLINDALWDRFFCSSISTMPEKSGTSEAKDTLTNFLSGEEDLPVARYKKTSTSYSDEAIIERLMEDDGWKYVAQYLVIDGGFNVNSTSVDAWTATLMGLANRKLISNVDEGKLTEVEADKDTTSVLFSRFMLSTTDKSIDSDGSYSPMLGSSSLRRNSGATTAWGEVRLLSSDGIRSLAEEMVKQVRNRGPFLNMAEFINRRLDGSTTEYALKGALQAAIDETDINEAFNEVTLNNVPTGSIYAFGEADEGSAHSGAPGYLIQSDILNSLGNILTVRDDTFIIRSYGCVKNPKKAILAQAWCEATVQRTSQYVDPTNAIEDTVYNPDGTTGEGLSDINITFGRKFKVVSFRWLDHWDI